MKRFRLSSRIQTLTIWAWSQKAAEESAAFDYLMGEGPIFFPVSVEALTPEVSEIISASYSEGRSRRRSETVD